MFTMGAWLLEKQGEIYKMSSIQIIKLPNGKYSVRKKKFMSTYYYTSDNNWVMSVNLAIYNTLKEAQVAYRWATGAFEVIDPDK